MDAAGEKRYLLYTFQSIRVAPGSAVEQGVEWRK